MANTIGGAKVTKIASLVVVLVGVETLRNEINRKGWELLSMTIDGMFLTIDVRKRDRSSERKRERSSERKRERSSERKQDRSSERKQDRSSVKINLRDILVDLRKLLPGRLVNYQRSHK
ncbi:hypothetical protein KEM48_006849 [Puccinia striiformis f. sp. tritici PST-130]|uniref:Uncharacterized protein n=1 Tax=Puccinia striiformis f. sp. tritici PST-78 TaxID=1165861 RepID=A0A0L0UTZ8_9BASI|nr:hypothetical protein KEM48_006849 [Puccinia striiformis f. sp. tritici PST-130]KNE90483.1 hypothetical protein PSTG_16101 [Puccinia striiformis f. sp. tritici PST-78]